MQVRSSLAIRSALQPIGQWLSAFEAGTVFFLLLSYIWYFQSRVHWLWAVLLGFVILSHVVRGETPAALGLRLGGFRDCARRYGLPVLLVAATATIAGFALDTLRDVEWWRVAGVLAGYCSWALFQQYLLNGYFVNRMHASLPEKYEYLAAPIGGVLFAAAHVPNTLLMVVTFIGGAVAAAAYLKHRNLLFLAFAHALIGTTIWFVVPDTVSHHLRVGPGMKRGHVHSVHRPTPLNDTLSAAIVRRDAPAGSRISQ
jgi:membrane protease YdiL (CAAX protease family)